MSSASSGWIQGVVAGGVDHGDETLGGSGSNVNTEAISCAACPRYVYVCRTADCVDDIGIMDAAGVFVSVLAPLTSVYLCENGVCGTARTEKETS